MGQALLRRTTVVGGMTLISRVLGFVRDVVLAAIFGADGQLDAFLVAFKLPNFLRRLFAEGAFSQAFVPVLASYRAQVSSEADSARAMAKLRAFIAAVMGNLSMVLVLIVVLAEWWSPGLITIFAPGFRQDPARLHLASQLLRITFPYIVLISLTAMSGAIMNSYQRFAIPAFTPVLLNVALIMAAVWWAPHSAHPIHTLAWAVIIGGVLQLILQVLALMRLRLCVWPTINWRHPGVRRVLRLMLPIFFGASVTQISLLIDNVFASFLPAGSISWLYYSDRFTYLPLGVIGVALSTVVLPHLSLQHAKKNELQYAHTVQWALRWVWFLGLPAALGLFLLAQPILITCLWRGAFSWHDMQMTSHSLMAFSLGLPAFMMIKILSSAFYAQHEVKTPVRVAMVALCVNVVFNFLLIRVLAHVGLALATTVAAWVNVMGLWWFLRKRLAVLPTLFVFVARLCVAAAAAAVALWWLSPVIVRWRQASLFWRVWHLVGLMAVAVLVYGLVLWLLGCRLRHFSDKQA